MGEKVVKSGAICKLPFHCFAALFDLDSELSQSVGKRRRLLIAQSEGGLCHDTARTIQFDKHAIFFQVLIQGH